MGERVKPEIEQVPPEVMDTITDNLEVSWANARTLREVLGETDPENRRVRVECRSSSMDLGGFFLDAEHSSPAFRSRIYIGPNSGDAVTGTLDGLVSREVDGVKQLQIQVNLGIVNLGAPELPALCYFNFDKTLEGCWIDRA